MSSFTWSYWPGPIPDPDPAYQSWACELTPHVWARVSPMVDSHLDHHGAPPRLLGVWSWEVFQTDDLGTAAENGDYPDDRYLDGGEAPSREAAIEAVEAFLRARTL